MKYCKECGQCLPDEASVCPICKSSAENALSAPETPYEREKYVNGPAYSYKKPIVTFTIIAINFALWLIITILGYRGIDLTSLLSMHRGAVSYGQVYRILTSIFTHEEFLHFAFNSYAILIYGQILEPSIGKGKFLAVYFASGLVGNLLSFAFISNPSIGASGAVFGLLGAIIAIHFISPSALSRSLFRSILLSIILTTAYSFRGGINNFAHFGGLFGGYIMMCILLDSPYRRKFFTNRFLMFVLALVISVGSLLIGALKVTSGELSYAPYSFMEFFASADMYDEAEDFAEDVLTLNPPYFKADALAVKMIESKKENDLKDFYFYEEKFTAEIIAGNLMSSQAIYEDLMNILGESL